jgi:hypothetical protein
MGWICASAHHFRAPIVHACKMYTYKVQAHEIHAHEIPAHKMHTREIYTREIYVHRSVAFSVGYGGAGITKTCPRTKPARQRRRRQLASSNIMSTPSSHHG